MSKLEVKNCTVCKKELSLINFIQYSTTKKYNGRCKSCEKEYQKIWRQKNAKINYQKNKEKCASRSKAYREKNRDSLNSKNKIWILNNKEKVKKRKNKYEKEKRKSNSSYNLRISLSNSINKFLKKNNSQKNGSILNYLDYNINDLKQHLESLFEPWMNWNNRGKFVIKTWNDNDESTWTWNVDHVIPQSDLPYTSMEDENFKKCWALENLRPLSAKQNVLDGTSRIRHKKE